MRYVFNPFTGNFDLAGSAAIPDPLVVNDLTVNNLLIANHIHGNVAGALYVHVKNTSGVTLAKGTPVYIVGAVGDTTTLEVAAADAANADKTPAIGLLETALDNNQSGHAVMFGEITGFNTASYQINDELYLASGGGLTATRPTSGHNQGLAVVGRVHATTGTVLVWVASGIPPTDLSYDAASREVRSSTGADVVLPLVSASAAGLAPAFTSATGKVLTDGGWATPVPLFAPCEILIVGGGGPAPDVTYGTTPGASGGGGGGRVEFCTGINVLRGVALTVTVGAAGNQSALGPIVAAAGSAGGAAAVPGSGGNGNGSATAGSGGGGGTIGQATTGGIGGTETLTNNNFVINGNTIAQINEYSKAGGSGSSGAATVRASGGGGGAGSAGGNGVAGPIPGTGGAGILLSITGAAVTYGAGGAGAGTNADTNGANGAANTGNGGGGAARTVAGTSTGGTGGSGIVIIAYPDTYPAPAAILGAYTQPTRSGWRVYQFTGSGSITL